MSSPYLTWFHAQAGHAPHPWQAELGSDAACSDRLIRIPTGLGKTLGVLAAWTYHRLIRADPAWPRRLVLCLPMRVLVEQTEAVVRAWLAGLGRLWTENSTRPAPGEVGVHLLLGGAASRDWHLFPEAEAVLVGTQDMLLSRALNRGYGSARGRWPMEHALLRQDALWVLDEVQLMDVGLRTSVQLQAFHDPNAVHRPLVSWWMSATLQPAWLDTVDFSDRLPPLRDRALRVPPPQRTGPLFDAKKPVRLETLPAADDRNREAWAQRVLAAHRAAPTTNHGRLTLAIANTVEDARLLHDALRKQLAARGSEPIDLRLVHSRFRGRERATWRATFLNRDACTIGADRIIIATQVVEAGVDISADVLVTPLAPWPSLVQRFGRAARYGGTATILVLDRQLAEKSAAPYTEGELLAARQVLEGLRDVGLGTLEALEDRLAAEDPDLLARLYPYTPLHTLTQTELAELFDTGPDLTGSDLDISRFIRSGDDRDLQVWWWPVEGDPSPDLQPMRHALCPVPVKDARTWLTDAKDRAPAAWRWSYLGGAWERVRRPNDLTPGQLILVDAAGGGYLPDRGFVGAESRAAVECHDADRKRDDDFHKLLAADNAQDHEDLSELRGYKTIAFHGRETGEEARALATALALDPALTRLLDLAGRLHDLGKAHEVFQNAITRRPAPTDRTDLAKAPPDAWKRGKIFTRPGFRHELASTLAILEVLYQTCPEHPALLGQHRPLIELGVLQADRAHLATTRPAPTGLLAELAALDAPQLDLVLYLVCAHHGKVRGTWQQTPDDQAARPTTDHRMPLRGVLDGDRFPATALADADDNFTTLPALTLSLDPARLGLSPRYGASWRERVTGLRRAHGDATLVFLETLLRVADIRASQRTTPDPVLPEESAP